MSSKILEPKWFYDELKNAISSVEEISNEKVRRSLVQRAETEKKIKKIEREFEEVKEFDQKTIERYRGFGKIKEELQRIDTDLDLSIDRNNRNIGIIFACKPFLIGPSTLESLINQTPSTYEYINQGKLPFDNIFFEFAESLELGIPFLNGKYPARGMHLGKMPSGQANENEYILRVFYKKEDIISVTHLVLDRSQNPRFEGATYPAYLRTKVSQETNPEKGINYLIEKNNLVKICRDDNKILDFFAGRIKESEIYTEEVNLKSVENSEALTQLPNLAINLINYINAHNVTVVRRDREIIELQRDERNKKKKLTSMQPFYMITIKDKVYEEPDTPKEVGLWTLQERLFVRGHDRKYRNQEGLIRMTSWIPPHIKGPDGAPFRETRYQVLHEKLKREEELYKKYGVHEYSEDMTMPGSTSQQRGGNR